MATAAGAVGSQRNGGRRMRVVNLTPHVVTVVDERSRVIRRWPRSTEPARVEAVRVPVGMEVDGVPNVRGCTEPLREGMEIRKQDGYGSLLGGGTR